VCCRRVPVRGGGVCADRRLGRSVQQKFTFEGDGLSGTSSVLSALTPSARVARRAAATCAHGNSTCSLPAAPAGADYRKEGSHAFYTEASTFRLARATTSLCARDSFRPRARSAARAPRARRAIALGRAWAPRCTSRRKTCSGGALSASTRRSSERLRYAFARRAADARAHSAHRPPYPWTAVDGLACDEGRCPRVRGTPVRLHHPGCKRLVLSCGLTARACRVIHLSA
jgi:hypothetical protein